MQVHDIKTPAAMLAPAVFADETIQPALQSAGEIEICAVDGQHERFIQNARVEPVGQDQIESARMAEAICRLFTFVDTGEAKPPSFRRLADGRHNRG